MSTSSVRTRVRPRARARTRAHVSARATLGGLFGIALVLAPIGLALGTTPGAAASPAKAARPFLVLQPRTFPPPQVTFTVNTTNDTHVSPSTGTACTDSGGSCSLRAAVEAATNLRETVQINVPPGTYNLTAGSLTPGDPAGMQITGTAAGVTVTNSGTATDLVATEQAPTRNTGSFTSLANVTLSGSTGGALDVTDDDDVVTVTGVTLSGNSFSGDGGAVFNDGQFWGTNCVFSGNSASGATTDGGALFNGFGSVRLTGDTFAGNHAGAEGGAVFNADGPAAIDNSTFNSNSVTSTGSTPAEGGALFADEETELTGDTFSGNSVTSPSTVDAFGGAVYNSYGGSVVTNSTFAGNTATSGSTTTTGGGGGAFYDGAGVTITGSTFSGNSASTGNGGGFYEGLSAFGASLSADTFTGNSATGAGDLTGLTPFRQGHGGGVMCNDVCNITNVTVSSNTAQQGGGGIANQDSVIMSSTLVSHNRANLGGGIWAGWNVQATSVAVVDNTSTGAADAGGGVYEPGEASGGDNRVDFIGVTVAGNVSDAGAGLALDGSNTAQGGGTLSNSTMADNRTPGGTEAECAVIHTSAAVFPVGSAGGNVIGDTSCALTTNSDRQGASEQGYWEDASDGGIFTYNTGFFGSMGGKALNKPIVGMAHTPGNQGYWEVASDGGIFSFGDAGFSGSMGGKPLNAPVVGIASTPDGGGYIEVASDGGVFAFGDAGFYGSMGGIPLNQPVVGLAMTPDGRGYWEIASDGGIFSFGDAGFFGSMGGKPLNKPIVGMAPAVDGSGYFEVASDGGVFNFGSAGFFGSAGGLHLNAPVVGIAAAPDNAGYWTFASDGGVFNYGTGAQFKGSAGALHLVRPIVGGAGT